MTKAGDYCVRACTALNKVPAACICVLLFITQAAIIDYYLVKHINTALLTWVVADVFNLIILIVAIYQAYSRLNQHEENKRRDGFSIAWVSWLAINISVSAKCIVIFTTFSTELEEAEPSFFGPNTLKTAVALGSCIFLVLLITQHDAPLGSAERLYIEELTDTVVFDILDTVDILDVLFDEENRSLFWPGLEEGILAVAALNLLLPTVPLFTLRRTSFGQKKLSKALVYTHRLLIVLSINVPNLLIRLILWHGFSVGVSPFTLKNVICISLTLYEFYEHKKEKYEEHERERLEEARNNRNAIGWQEDSDFASSHRRVSNSSD